MPAPVGGEPWKFQFQHFRKLSETLPVDSRDGVAKDRVEGGEEEGVRGSVHDEQAGAKEQDLEYIIFSIILGISSQMGWT